MFPLMTADDFKEAAKRTRFLQVEEERRKRIFNAKQRLIGIDYAALDEQINEKKERERQEKLEEELWNKKVEQNMNMVRMMDKQKEADRQQSLKELNEYRLQFQKFEDRREFDLNDPVAYKTPLVLDPKDKRFGVSSITRFEGDEDDPGSRAKLQLEQQHVWLQQQMMERNQQECARRAADLALEEAEIAEGLRFRALRDIEEQCRREQIKKTALFNKALAVKKMQEKYEEMKKEAEDIETHKMNVLTANLHLEDGGGQSALGPNRKSSSTYKGMSLAEKEEIKAIQLHQISEGRDRRRAEEAEEKAWNDYQMGLQQSIRFIDMKHAAEVARHEAQIRQENKNLLEEQIARKQFLDSHVYKNKCSEEYFKQFNKSTR
ncbi:RIB43A [Nesidiocoris tenuis]|uniref:RIB43A n=1 Tax=Nesidiocoris tenuis TaxID=355587 RepID=A0ABN7B165_9HEMI|nr:RIB43A [Nesidiocoris tenuis]